MALGVTLTRSAGRPWFELFFFVGGVFYRDPPSPGPAGFCPYFFLKNTKNFKKKQGFSGTN